MRCSSSIRSIVPLALEITPSRIPRRRQRRQVRRPPPTGPRGPRRYTLSSSTTASFEPVLVRPPRGRPSTRSAARPVGLTRSGRPRASEVVTAVAGLVVRRPAERPERGGSSGSGSTTTPPASKSIARSGGTARCVGCAETGSGQALDRRHWRPSGSGTASARRRQPCAMSVMGDPLHETMTIWRLVVHRADEPRRADARDDTTGASPSASSARSRRSDGGRVPLRAGWPATGRRHLAAAVDDRHHRPQPRAGADRRLAEPDPAHLPRREIAVVLRGTRPTSSSIPATGGDGLRRAAGGCGDRRAGLDDPPEIVDIGDSRGRVVLDPVLPPPPPAERRPGGDDPVRWIYFTSGTTSEPKGVRHTDGTLLAGGRGLAWRARDCDRPTWGRSPSRSPTSPVPTTW